jgi:thiol-disulfide isomerase/thioredoxin
MTLATHKPFLICLLVLSLLLPGLSSAASALDTSPFSGLDGRPVKIQSLKGKVVVANFWATWCAPCREEAPMLNRLSRQWKNRGIVIVGIALDNKPAVQRFVAQEKIAYPVWLGNDSTMDLLPEMGNPAMGLPFTVILDPQGKQVGTLLGLLKEADLQRALKPYL